MLITNFQDMEGRIIKIVFTRNVYRRITRVDAITCTGVISSVHVTCKDNFNNTAFHIKMPSASVCMSIAWVLLVMFLRLLCKSAM